MTYSNRYTCSNVFFSLLVVLKMINCHDNDSKGLLSFFFTLFPVVIWITIYCIPTLPPHSITDYLQHIQ